MRTVTTIREDVAAANWDSAKREKWTGQEGPFFAF